MMRFDEEKEVPYLWTVSVLREEVVGHSGFGGGWGGYGVVFDIITTNRIT